MKTTSKTIKTKNPRWERLKERLKFKFRSAIGWILLGLCIMFFTIILEERTDMSIEANRIIIQVLSHLGIGFFVLGALSILVDLDHWTSYFKKRLSEIVTEQKYLENYNADQLIQLQTNVLKTYFKDDDIGKDDTFLTYYQNNILELIGSPIRLGVEAKIIIKYADESSKDRVKIHEEISWRCKKNRDNIQPEIKWMPVKDEFEHVEFNCIRLEHEDFKMTTEGRREIKITKDKLEKEWLQEDVNGFIMPLNEYKDKDGLKITVVVDVINPTSRLIAWRMAHISKGVSITVLFPEDLAVATEVYSLSEDSYEEDKEPGYYSWKCKDWLLPNEGVALQLVPKKNNEDYVEPPDMSA